jgi:hypothetical protein
MTIKYEVIDLHNPFPSPLSTELCLVYLLLDNYVL